MPWSLRMVLYASALLLIILIYFGCRYFISIKRLEKSPKWLYRLLFYIPAALFLFYPAAGLYEYYTEGSFSRTAYPDSIIYIFWFGVIFMGVMFNWLLLHDLLRPLSARFFRGDKVIRNRTFARMFLFISMFTFFYTAGKLIWDTYRITVQEITYILPDGELSLPLTVVHIADLHADRYTDDSKMARYVKKINRAGPDIVIFGGDLITSGTDFIEAGANALGNIQSTYGTFAVIGDHDFWVDKQIVSDALRERGITVLDNENAWIEHDGKSVKITGVTELYSRRIAQTVLDSLLYENRGEVLRIAAGHQASDRLIEETGRAGVHQLLGGHTHGGQIRVPLLFYPVTAARAETAYIKGSWMMGDMLLHVNSGLGFTLAPVRYNAPARVSVIKVSS